MRPIPRRFRVPLGIAVAGTLTAVGLATIPNRHGEYDPNLAILTLTLVAVIWYTYLTYRSVHREPPGYLLIQLEYEWAFESLYPGVRNPTERTLEARFMLDVWVDGVKVTTDEFYSGQESKRLGPTQGFRGMVDLRPHTMLKRDAYNQVISGAKEVLVRFTATWTDDLGDSGGALPVFKRIEPQQARQHDLVAHSEIQRYFGSLPGF